MTSYTPAGQRKSHSYQLDIIADNGGKQTQFFDSLEDLAKAARDACYPRENYDYPAYYYASNPRSAHWVQTHLRASSLRGNALDVLTLCEWGGATRRYYRYGSLDGYVRRQGPVPGIHGYSGGPSYKNCRTMAERRLNASRMADEGEPECRPRRRDTYLFNSWDGRPRPTPRCWKQQSRGRKAGDR